MDKIEEIKAEIIKQFIAPFVAKYYQNYGVTFYQKSNMSVLIFNDPKVDEGITIEGKHYSFTHINAEKEEFSKTNHIVEYHLGLTETDTNEPVDVDIKVSYSRHNNFSYKIINH